MIYIFNYLKKIIIFSLFNMTSTIDTNMVNSKADTNIPGKEEETKDYTNNINMNEGK